MIEPDTIKLLRECDSGVKMGVSSIDEVLDRVDDERFKMRLVDSKKEHETLGDEIQAYLGEYGDEGKEPNLMAQGMSWMKTNVKLAMDASDATIADLMTDGCGMGIKSLCRYLNQYKAADESSKSIAKRLVYIEDRLVQDIRPFL